ncbi:MAG: HypC/HybG/HupF family hydrogenase formation chaperone [Actinobacteria bacterium]|nr:HypC/HybG/HupF family hydrogenase formation chaperone [Actinomycetota bacterium]MCG2818126.1 HypC/HybG/HupF family hydrogenase formation chaperone [Actinomycetes bacterium]MBU4218921.1 HypC/HybG/HupF family hydrogenase formation chaperone [Actinomycetota bacterium]MBU4359668.1 HypC/HybG/HupF family hydrogenase formation chaperone [Actinomycetota bacterium]MBU4393248.1 HypC/HybG/HupF family hydrogenase formation chaperone [Actinomycetota bacterium]
MCLAVPAEVVEILQNDVAFIDVGGLRKKINLSLVEGVRTGDFVLVHAGFAIEIIDEEEARKTMELFEEMARLDEIR